MSKRRLSQSSPQPSRKRLLEAFIKQAVLLFCERRATSFRPRHETRMLHWIRRLDSIFDDSAACFLKLAICLLVELRRAGAEADIACSTSDVCTLRDPSIDSTKLLRLIVLL